MAREPSIYTYEICHVLKYKIFNEKHFCASKKKEKVVNCGLSVRKFKKMGINLNCLTKKYKKIWNFLTETQKKKKVGNFFLQKNTFIANGLRLVILTELIWPKMD